eukprot:2185768-Pyramimonas_sp.AAC.1
MRKRATAESFRAHLRLHHSGCVKVEVSNALNNSGACATDGARARAGGLAGLDPMRCPSALIRNAPGPRMPKGL